MDITRRCGLRAILVAAPVLFAARARAQTSAQNWPQRPVKFIVPLGPASAVDIGSRLIADRLMARWGKPIVIENRPGANGLIAIQAFVSANDDYTFLSSGSGTFTVHPLQYKKLPYSLADVVPIARISTTIVGIGVPAAMSVGTLAEWVAQAKAKPGEFNAAAVPGITEFIFDYFVKSEGLNVQKAPYRDVVQAATDVGEGRVQIFMGSYAILKPHVQGDRIRMLAVTSEKRSPILPDVPTVLEAGFPTLQLDGLVGLFGHKGIDNNLLEKIASDVTAVVGDPEIAAKMANTAQVPSPGGPAEFTAAIDRQRARITEIARFLGIEPTQ